VSTMETPPPETPVQPVPEERRCPRCGSPLATDQEWCLHCGAAAETEVVEPRGWRVPLYLGGGLTALAVIGVILAIVALAGRDDVVAGNPSATPTPTPSSAAPPGATATTPPLATGTPLPSTTPDPNATTTPDPNATTTPDPNASPTASPTESATPEATATPDTGTTEGGSGSTFPAWTGNDGDYTIIVESADSQSGADKVAQQASDKGLSDVGILQSSDYSSLNGGYYVVFTGVYTSKSDAESALSGVRSDFKDAYVRQIKK